MSGLLQLGQVLAQPVERPLVEAAVVLEPGGGVGERFAAQVRRPLLGAAAARHEARPFEHLEVLADRLQRDGREERGELVDGGVAFGQPGEDGPAGRVGERAERDAERVVVGGGRRRSGRGQGQQHHAGRRGAAVGDGELARRGAGEQLAALAEHDRADQQPVLVDEPCGAEGLGELSAAVDEEVLAARLELGDRLDDVAGQERRVPRRLA